MPSGCCRWWPRSSSAACRCGSISTRSASSPPSPTRSATGSPSRRRCWPGIPRPTRQSRPCQMELTAALLAAHREGDPRRRILVINPEPSGTHIEPWNCATRSTPSRPRMRRGMPRSLIASPLTSRHCPVRSAASCRSFRPSSTDVTLTGATRFVGRLPDLWRIHSALHASESAIISGTSAPGLAIVSGFGGVGKSLVRAVVFALKRRDCVEPDEEARPLGPASPERSQ